MMREILFRGKSVNNGEWVEGFLVIDTIFCEDSVPIKHYHIDEMNLGTFPVEFQSGISETVDPETVGQFTGLSDKKEKRIFEGDVCRVTRPCVLAYGKITFQNGCFWFVDDGPGGMLRLCDIKMNGFEIEVIGNIHDNTEFQEGNKMINEKRIIPLQKRIIFAGDVFNSLMQEKGWSATEAADFVKAFRTVDGVEEVRCKDCKHWEDGYLGYCTKNHTAMDYDAFCSYGERRG